MNYSHEFLRCVQYNQGEEMDNIGTNVETEILKNSRYGLQSLNERQHIENCTNMNYRYSYCVLYAMFHNQPFGELTASQIVVSIGKELFYKKLSRKRVSTFGYNFIISVNIYINCIC